MKLFILLISALLFFTACSDEQERLIYVSDSSGKNQLYEMTLDEEGEIRKLTNSSDEEWGISVIGDNEISFFRREDPDSAFVRRFMLNLITGEEKELYQPEECLLSDDNMEYSQNHTLELYECKGELYVHYLLSRYTDHITRRLSGESKSPVWFPDNKRIAFSHKNGMFTDIYLMDIESKSYNNITASDYNDNAPEISPDGKWMLYSANIQSLNNYDIFVLNLDDLTLKNISRTPDWELSAHWAPDGKSIIYSSNQDGNWELYRYDVSTDRSRRLIRNEYYDGEGFIFRY
jgi:dipeptidyl aminopeptidase/acylaminoacyl peptidase